LSGLVVAVSGASGHIGRALMDALAASGEVAELRTVSRRQVAERPGLAHHHVRADVRSPAARELVAGADLLFHLAAQVWEGRGRGAAREMEEVNVGGTANLAGAAGATVLASSVVVYGAWPDNPLPMDEDWPARPNPECSYAVHKRDAERALEGSARRWAALRLCAVLGPNADARVVRSLTGYRLGVPAVRGAPQALQWLDERDAVSALMAAGRSLLQGGAACSCVLNVATDDWLGAGGAARLLGSRVVALPRRPLMALASVGREVRLSPFGPDRAVMLTGPLAVANERARRTLDWAPTRTSADVLAGAVLGSGPPASEGPGPAVLPSGVHSGWR
jgi:nucleoside-diphosphate-sugar epimerase